MYVNSKDQQSNKLLISYVTSILVSRQSTPNQFPNLSIEISFDCKTQSVEINLNLTLRMNNQIRCYIGLVESRMNSNKFRVWAQVGFDWASKKTKKILDEQ